MPYGANLCNKTACSGDATESCGGDGWQYNGTVRPTRALRYTCTRPAPDPDPVHPPRTTGDTRSVYSERLLIGYRWYDAHNVSFTTGFPFGHGLSFTEFGYSSLEVAVGGAAVAFRLTNTGTTAGSEVAQLYLGFPAAAGEPPKQLRGFAKRWLAAGESAVVRFALSARDFSIWNSAQHAWTPVRGEFRVLLGSSR